MSNFKPLAVLARPIIRGGGALALIFAFTFGITASSSAESSRALTDVKVPAIELLDGPAANGQAGVSALPKGRFINRADRICAAQVPAFSRVNVQLEEAAARMAEAEQAGQEDVFAAEFRKYGVLVGRLNPLITKRKMRIQKLRVNRRIAPRAYYRTLTRVNTTLRQLSRSVIALVDTPTQANVDRVARLGTQLSTVSNNHFKAGRNYGFRQCSKPFAVA